MESVVDSPIASLSLSLLLSPQHENTAATLSWCLPTPLSLGSSVFDRPLSLILSGLRLASLSFVFHPPCSSSFHQLCSCPTTERNLRSSLCAVAASHPAWPIAPRLPPSSITMLFSFRSSRWVAASSIRAIQPASHHPSPFRSDLLCVVNSPCG